MRTSCDETDLVELPMDEFEARYSRWRIFLLFLGAMAFVALGLRLGGAFWPPPESHRYPLPLIHATGWLSAVFFGLCGIAAVKKFFEHGVQLQIGRSGIRSASWSEDLIPWSEIREVTTWSYKGQRMIVLHLRDPARFPRRGAMAIWVPFNRKLTGGDIVISLVGTDRSYDSAMAAIERFGSRAVSHVAP